MTSSPDRDHDTDSAHGLDQPVGVEQVDGPVADRDHTLAFEMQQWLAATIDTIGALPLAGALIAVVLGAVALRKAMAKTDA